MSSIGKKLRKAVKKVYDLTSSRKSRFGKVTSLTPFGAHYWVRDGWSKAMKKMAGKSSAVNINAGLPAASYIPGTGFKRYV